MHVGRYVKELMHRGEVLNILAEHGNLREIQGAVRGFKHGDLLSWFVVRMFKTSMARGHVKILRFMLDSGFHVRHVGIQTILHDYAEAGSVSARSLACVCARARARVCVCVCVSARARARVCVLNDCD